MIHNIICRLSAIITASFLINVAIIEGILSNLKSCQVEFQLWSFSCDKLRYKIQILANFCLILCVFYLIYCLCFKNFLKLKTPENYYDEDEDEDYDNSGMHVHRIIFFKVIPIIFLIFIGLFFIFLVFSKNIYSPPRHLYYISNLKSNEQPVTGVSSHFQDSFTNIFRLRKRFLFKELRTEIKDNVGALPIIRNIPSVKKKRLGYLLRSIRLSGAEKYELRLRYLKFVVLTGFTVIIYILLLLRLNFCTMCR